jgi:murein DD-endopeptidase MepM/ murein hydrolase activator NlpD
MRSLSSLTRLILLLGLTLGLSGGGGVSTAAAGARPRPVLYAAQSGDSLAVVARRYRIDPSEIRSPQPFGAGPTLLLTPGQLLILPPRQSEAPPFVPLLADSDFVYGPAAVDFDTAAALRRAAGYLSHYRQYLRSTDWNSAAQIIDRVALENSISPRLLVALLETSSGCVAGPLAPEMDAYYPLGVVDFHYRDLYGQLRWAANELSRGYYGWRAGELLQIPLPDGTVFQPAPEANAATVALEHYFAALWAARLASVGHPWSLPGAEAAYAARSPATWRAAWDAAVAPNGDFAATYRRLFGPSTAAAPIFPPGVTQPPLQLPFEPDFTWSLSSGPHKAWETENALAALDFAPASKDPGCQPTTAYVAAMADGRVVRSEFGLVVQDLDGDGDERTGWALLYMHIETASRVPVGTYLQAGERIGHPSCEGGPATGTHVHVVRKYNGEWVAAGGPLPFVLSGWTAHNGAAPYQGTLTAAGQTVIAQPNGAAVTLIRLPTPTPLP